jgi:hypothetical protein
MVEKALGLLKNCWNSFESVEKPVVTALVFYSLKNTLGLLGK